LTKDINFLIWGPWCAMLFGTFFVAIGAALFRSGHLLYAALTLIPIAISIALFFHLVRQLEKLLHMKFRTPPPTGGGERNPSAMAEGVLFSYRIHLRLCISVDVSGVKWYILALWWEIVVN
jgi:hypothetical protein